MKHLDDLALLVGMILSIMIGIGILHFLINLGLGVITR